MGKSIDYEDWISSESCDDVDISIYGTTEFGLATYNFIFSIYKICEDDDDCIFSKYESVLWGQGSVSLIDSEIFMNSYYFYK